MDQHVEVLQFWGNMKSLGTEMKVLRYWNMLQKEVRLVKLPDTLDGYLGVHIKLLNLGKKQLSALYLKMETENIVIITIIQISSKFLQD